MIERAAFILLCATIFTIPWEKSVSAPGLGTITKLLGMATFALWAAAAAVKRSVRAPNAVLVAAAGFVLWCAATWFWSYDPQSTLAKSLTFAQLLVFAYIIWDLCRETDSLVRLLQMYVAGAGVASVATIVRYLAREQTYYRRYAAPGFDPNDLAMTVALAIPIALYLSLKGSWWARVVAALCCVAVLLTASRTAVIATFVGFGFAAVTWRRSTMAHKAAAVALFLILPAGMLWLAPKASRERIATTTTEITRGTLHKRTTIWKTGLKALKARPVQGVGAGAYPDAVKPWLGVPPVAGHEYVAHNAFLSVLVETGILGAALYGALLLLVAAFIWVLPSPERALWVTMALVWTLGALLLTWEHRKPGWLFIALVAVQWAGSFRRPLCQNGRDA